MSIFGSNSLVQRIQRWIKLSIIASIVINFIYHKYVRIKKLKVSIKSNDQVSMKISNGILVNQSRLAIARSPIDLSREIRKNLNRSRTRRQLINKVTNRCTTYCFLTVMTDSSGATRSEFKESPAFLTSLPSLSLFLFFLSSFPCPETSTEQVVSRNPVALTVSRTTVHDITRIRDYWVCVVVTLRRV